MMMDSSRAKKVILPYPYDDVRFWRKAVRQAMAGR